MRGHPFLNVLSHEGNRTMKRRFLYITTFVCVAAVATVCLLAASAGGTDSVDAVNPAQPISSTTSRTPTQPDQAPAPDLEKYYQIEFTCTEDFQWPENWCDYDHDYGGGFYVDADDVSTPPTWIWLERPQGLCPTVLVCYDYFACIYIPSDATTTTSPYGCELTVLGNYPTCYDCFDDWMEPE